MKTKNLFGAAVVAFLAVLSSACTTVRTYNAAGDVTGSCRISGFPTKHGGQCIGYANGK